MNKDKKGAGKLASYAVILILMIIIVIIIAAMADDRERNFRSQIEQTTQTNMTIQDEIVAIKDENYKLSRQIDELEPKAEEAEKLSASLEALTDILNTFNEGNAEEAAAKYAEIDPSSVPENLVEMYNLVGATINSK